MCMEFANTSTNVRLFYEKHSSKFYISVYGIC
eukprot:UN14676